jgi:hypothetical protein
MLRSNRYEKKETAAKFYFSSERVSFLLRNGLDSFLHLPTPLGQWSPCPKPD